jgi:hypothetical protein
MFDAEFDRDEHNSILTIAIERRMEPFYSRTDLRTRLN